MFSSPAAGTLTRKMKVVPPEKKNRKVNLMSDPSNPDLVEQLWVSYSRLTMVSGDSVVPVDMVDECGFKFAIREAISVTRRETLEQAAKLSDGMANSCDEHGTEHFCEYFGCGSFDKLAADIRRIGENK